MDEGNQTIRKLIWEEQRGREDSVFGILQKAHRSAKASGLPGNACLRRFYPALGGAA